MRDNAKQKIGTVKKTMHAKKESLLGAMQNVRKKTSTKVNRASQAAPTTDKKTNRHSLKKKN